VSFEKEIFHYHSLFCSIHPNIHNIYIKCRSKRSSAPDPMDRFSRCTDMIDSETDLVSRAASAWWLWLIKITSQIIRRPNQMLDRPR
jgi:hypothetical protein